MRKPPHSREQQQAKHINKNNKSARQAHHKPRAITTTCITYHSQGRYGSIRPFQNLEIYENIFK